MSSSGREQRKVEKTDADFYILVENNFVGKGD